MHRFVLLLLTTSFLAACAQDKPALTPAQLTVVVKDEQGNAVAGAKVICAPTGTRTIPDPIPEPLQGVTDAAGRCRFGPLSNKVYSILARAETHGAWGSADFTKSSEATIDLTLKRGVSRPITVEDIEGKPIPGVAVVYNDSLFLGKTDEKGQFVLPNLKPGEGYYFRFLKEGFGFAGWRYSIGGENRNIVMKPGALVEGTVKDAEGRIVPGAIVYSYPFEVQTNEQGQFRLGWFPVENHPVQIKAQFQKDNVRLLARHSIESKQGMAPVDLVLRPEDEVIDKGEKVIVEGTVVMKDSGDPVPSTIYFLESDSRDHWSRISTNRDGVFRIESLAMRKAVFLRAVPDRNTLFCTNGNAPIRLEQGQTVKDVVLTVDKGCAIGGRVLDQEGNGVGGAEITLIDLDIDSPPISSFPQPVITNRGGAFAMSNLRRPDKSYQLLVKVPGRSRVVPHEVAVPGKGQIARTEIRLEAPMPEGLLRGLVVDVEGKPLSGVSVWMNGRETGGIATTDDDGRFEMLFQVREAQRVRLQVHAERQIFLGERETPVGPDVEIVSGGEQSIEPGKTVEAERVVLRVARYITGRIANPAGTPVEAQVEILGGDSRMSDFASEGKFMLRKIPASPFVLEVTEEGYRARILEPGRDFPADAQEIQVTLQKGPFAEGSSVFSQVTGREETDEVIESMPAGKQIQERCRDAYPSMARYKNQ